MIDRYGPAIEFDLHKIGLDLLDWFRGRYRWAKLWRLISHLGAGSAYWAARAGDVEAAEQYFSVHGEDEGERAGAGTPDLVDMTLSNQLLMQTVDLLRVVNARLEVLSGAKPDPVRPMPRPKTGVEQALINIENRNLDALTSEAYSAMERFEVGKHGN